jgi:hypothetical protein
LINLPIKAAVVLTILTVGSSGCGNTPTSASQNGAPNVTVAFEGSSTCAIKRGVTDDR